MSVNTQYQQLDTNVDNAPHQSASTNNLQTFPSNTNVPQSSNIAPSLTTNFMPNNNIQQSSNGGLSLPNHFMPPLATQSVPIAPYPMPDHTSTSPHTNGQNLPAIPYNFLGQLIQNVVSMELQKMFHSQSSNQA